MYCSITLYLTPCRPKSLQKLIILTFLCYCVCSSMSSLLRPALARVLKEGTSTGSNLVAFSGGVDSSLVAALLHEAFPGRAYACIGKL